MDRNSAAPVWLITGCSTGFGRALAGRVLARGNRCVVTSRNAKDVEDIVRPYPHTALALALDVRDAEQRNGAVAKAEEVFGRIDVLVNNAGHGYLAAFEEGDERDIRAMFETNFFGLVAMTQRVLPGMRARRRGHIVNISSIGGIVGNPSSGFYSATKFAVEGVSEALAKEVAPFGIRVTLIEPGPFRTDFSGRSIREVASPIAEYAEVAGARRVQLRQASGKQPGDPVRAADAIIDAVESKDPPLHLVLGRVGVERVREKLTSFLRSIDEWEAVSLGTDYPPGSEPQAGGLGGGARRHG